ncbi:hypothetical protein L1049_023139 [Liquidambar formosana]|uniref:Uncharacterized protein n=1 Tax=Liquidambar formosana TaxID=63359 RepID=A0AAP0RFG7_LIQFO
MGSSPLLKTAIFLFPLLLLSFTTLCYATRTLSSIATTQSTVLTYHNGPLLSGNLSLSITWYGKFSPAQRSILMDFLHSLNPTNPNPKAHPNPSVSSWWKTLESYNTFIPKKPQKISRNPNNAIGLEVQKQTLDQSYALGRFLTRTQISSLAEKGSRGGDVGLVFTADDVAVEGFCMSSCAHHGSVPKTRWVYMWVGNSASQCPGQCAWPFHQPIYGPQSQPLVAPNGDVGVDGMVIGLASTLAAAITNPFGNGLLPGAHIGSARSCVGLSWDLWEWGIPWLCWGAASGFNYRGEL